MHSWVDSHETYARTHIHFVYNIFVYTFIMLYIYMYVYIYSLCVGDLLGIGLWRKGLEVSTGTYLGKGAAAGVEDVHIPEINRR